MRDQRKPCQAGSAIPLKARDEDGSAVVDFVLVLAMVIPLVLGVIQLGLVLHVRNTLTAAASEGARVAARADRGEADGVHRTRTRIAGALSARYTQDIEGTATTVGGLRGVEIKVRARVPALGLWGPSVELEATGHAINEVAP